MQTSSTRRGIGILLSYAYSIAQIVVQLAYVPILLTGIGQSEYGLYQLIGSIMAYLISINGILATGVGRFYCLFLAQKNQKQMENTLAISKRMYWCLSVLTSLVIVVLIFIVQSVYAASLSSSQIQECAAMLVVLGLNCIITMNNTINVATITAYERFGFLKGIQLAVLILQPIVVAILIQFFPSALTVTLVILGMNIIAAISMRIFAQGVLHIKWTYHGFDCKLAKDLIAFSGTIVLVVIADQIFWKTDQLIIGFFFGTSPVAVYAVGAQVIMAYMALGTSISSVFLPRVSELYHGSKNLNELSKLFIKVGRFTFMVCSLVLFAFAIYGKEFIKLWAGASFEQAYIIALIIMIPFTVDLIQNLGLTILQVMNKYLFRGVMYFAIACLNIVATIILVPKVGIIGAAISTSVAMFIGNGFAMNLYYSKCIGLNVSDFWKSIGRLSIPVMLYSALFGIMVHYFISPVYPILFVCSGIIFVITYIIILWFAGTTQEEKALIKGFVLKTGQHNKL